MPAVAPPPPVPVSDPAGVGEALHRLVADLLPLRRCITGDGLRQTLLALGERVPLRITEVPTGTRVLDWTVPKEWRVRQAYLARPDGTRIVDWADSPLHLVQYSVAVRDRMPLWALRSHLHTVPGRPSLVPYRTSYYAPTWGFCLSQDALDALAAEIGEGGEVEVVVEADQVEGSLTYGEVVVEGETEDEILLSAHACHPALANDNASSLAVATVLARRLLDGPRLRHTVRVLFAPGTIGAITWLDRNHAALGQIRHGLVLANLGDGGAASPTSRRGPGRWAPRAPSTAPWRSPCATSATPSTSARSRRPATTSASSRAPGSTCPSAA